MFKLPDYRKGKKVIYNNEECVVTNIAEYNGNYVYIITNLAGDQHGPLAASEMVAYPLASPIPADTDVR